jgi:CspA family cold shock protein
MLRTGKIKFYNRDKGFGFIIEGANEGTNEFFFHASQVFPETPLDKEAAVTFTVGQGKKGTEAKAIAIEATRIKIYIDDIESGGKEEAFVREINMLSPRSEISVLSSAYGMPDSTRNKAAKTVTYRFEYRGETREYVVDNPYLFPRREDSESLMAMSAEVYEWVNVVDKQPAPKVVASVKSYQAQRSLN